jgi:hypothetical protein
VNVATATERAERSAATDERHEQVFQTLSNERRRVVVEELIGGETVELRELSRRVAAAENGKPAHAVTSTERRRAYTALQQVHLPQMDEAGVLDYDAHRGTVRPTDGLDDLHVYLEVVADDDVPWSVYYLVLSVLAASVLSASTLGVPPFGYLPMVGLAWGVVAFVFASACVHVRRTNRNRIDR